LSVRANLGRRGTRGASWCGGRHSRRSSGCCRCLSSRSSSSRSRSSSWSSSSSRSSRSRSSWSRSRSSGLCRCCSLRDVGARVRSRGLAPLLARRAPGLTAGASRSPLGNSVDERSVSSAFGEHVDDGRVALAVCQVERRQRVGRLLVDVGAVLEQQPHELGVVGLLARNVQRRLAALVLGIDERWRIVREEQLGDLDAAIRARLVQWRPTVLASEIQGERDTR